jgi:tetratricopeptide (TPR) repeat protein
MAPAGADDVPEKIRDQAVRLMNRGHAFMVGASPDHLDAALRNYNGAVDLLRTLPHERVPAWRNSLAAALMNLGHLLHRRHGLAQADGALAAFDEAAGLLRTLLPADRPWSRRNLAGTLVNRAGLLLDLGRVTKAKADAHEAVALARVGEDHDLIDVELALKSRRVLCDALGRSIVEPDADQNAMAAAASDVVDDALALIRAWDPRAGVRFRPLALRFFRFGAQLYRLHQPHFLAEFLLEQLGSAFGSDTEFRAIAIANIDAALAARPATPWLTFGDPATERQVETWRGLEAARARLASAA